MRIALIIKAVAVLLMLAVVGGTIYLMKEYTGSVQDLPGAMMERQRMVEEKLKTKTEEGGSSVMNLVKKRFNEPRNYWPKNPWRKQRKR